MKKLNIGFIIGTITPEMKKKATYSDRYATGLILELNVYILDIFGDQPDFSLSYFKERPTLDVAEMLHGTTTYFKTPPAERKPLLNFFCTEPPAVLIPENSEYEFDQNELFNITVENDSEKLTDLFLEKVDALIIIGGSHATNDPVANFEKVLTIAKERKIEVYRPRFFGEQVYPLFEKWIKRLPNGLTTDEKLALMDSGNVTENIRLILKGLKSTRR